MKYNRAMFSEADLRRALPFADFTHCNLEQGACGVSTDSRTIEQGNIFVALRGDVFDGHKFVHSVASSAAAIIVDQTWLATQSAIPSHVVAVPDTTRALAALAAFHRNRSATRIVAIAGSNGKTTTKEMCTHILSKYATVCSTQANENNIIGVAGTLLSIEPNHQYAVVEIGTNNIGEVRDLTLMTRPDVCVITTISEEHLDGLGTLQGVAEEELSLFSIMQHTAHLVCNVDSEFLQPYANAANTTTFGSSQPADIVGVVTLDPTGNTKVHFDYRGQHLAANPRTVGVAAGLNAIAACAVTVALGLPLDMACSAVDSYEERIAAGGYGRMALDKADNTLLLNDCYNASPASMKAALQTLESVSQDPKVAVLGDMFELGEHALDFHQQVLNEALSFDSIQRIVVLGEIFHRAAEAVQSSRISKAADHVEAAALAKEQLKSMGTCLVKGSRGMHMEKVIGAIKEDT